ncbi:MAG: hypothetical protein JXD23_09410 [Spirochaetales bacterium]|nr:hypothetical protein [Spirochaetales bacterium]
METLNQGREKPILVTVIGILSIAFCLATGALFLYGIVSNSNQLRRFIEEPPLKGLSIDVLKNDLYQVTRQYGRWLWALDLAKMAIALTGLTGGILILLSKRTGGLILKIYVLVSMAALAFAIGLAVYFAGEERIVLREFYQAQGMPPEDIEKSAVTLTDFSSFFWIVFLANLEILWPIVVFILMSTKKVRAYFRRPIEMTGT